jgi:hypothetical protein
MSNDSSKHSQCEIQKLYTKNYYMIYYSIVQYCTFSLVQSVYELRV